MFIIEKYGVFTIHENNQGCKFKIIEKLKNGARLIEFLDIHNYKKIVKIDNILQKEVKNPFYPHLYDRGYIGVGKYVSRINNHTTRAYNNWYSMMERCYNEKYHIKHPTYKNCTVCEEWYNFQNFAKWFEENYPHHIEDIKFQLDKDLLQQGVENKVYSPNTCVFLPSRVNVWIIDIIKSNTSGYKGAYFENSRKNFAVAYTDFDLKKQILAHGFKTLESAVDYYSEKRYFESEKVKNYMRNLNYLSENIIQLIK